jgi:hypothetical protein
MGFGGLRTLCIAGLSLAAACTQALAAKRVALVIGNSTYQNVARLPNPSRDATAIADLLKKAGFDVVSLQQDAGNLEFKRAIRRFEDSARDSDVAVVYYAGHGIEIGGVNYMVPVDAKLATDLDAQDEAITLDRIVDAVDSAKQLRLVILDACRDNPFVTTMKRQRTALRGMSSGLSKVEPTSSGTLVAYAAKAGSTADDGAGDHSPFTTALLHNLTTPGLDIRIALGRVRDEVLKATGQRQEPFVYGSLGGETVSLVTTPAAPAPAVAAAAPSVDPNADARRDYQYFERVGTKDAWDAFLKMYSTGMYAELARAQRAKLAAAEAAGQPRSDAHLASPSATPAPAPEKKPAAVAAAVPPPSSDPAPATPAGPAPGEVARMLQTELARVGCYGGTVTGEWNTQSRRGVEGFNQYAKTKLDPKTANLDALYAVRDKQGRVCPLECNSGFRSDGNVCGRIACDDGSVLNDKGVCEPSKGRAKQATRPPPEQKRQAAPAQTSNAKAGQSGGGQQQYACDRFGCQPVRKGCSVRTSQFGVETQQTVVCN